MTSRSSSWHHGCVATDTIYGDVQGIDKVLKFKSLHNRGNKSDLIVDLLKGLSVQECIDTLDAAKRKILSKSVNN